MKTSDISLEYIKSLSKKKKYNVQVRSLNKIFEKEIDASILDQSFENFRKNNNLIITSDYYFKSDSFTPRNIILISPIYYAYYTNLIFKIFRDSIFIQNNILDFSSKRIETYYSGILQYTQNKELINKNATFDKSYNQFKQSREELFGKYILKLDIKDFFNSIPTNELIKKLNNCIRSSKEKIQDLKGFFEYTKISTLPQFHYSIGSSILSQFYLSQFDIEINNILDSLDANMLRFVDDMYIYKNTPFEIKDYHMLIDKINSLLWKDHLTLNLNKTKLYNNEKNFEDSYKLIDTTGYDLELDYIVEESIKQRAIEVVSDNTLYNFLLELNKLYEERGIDIGKYSEMLIEISDDDHSKIFNRIIYYEWGRMDFDKLMKLANNWRFIFFNPSQFTILLIKIINHLEYKTKMNLPNKKELLKHLENIDKMALREIICVNTLLIQSKNERQKVMTLIENIDSDYISFIENYL